MKRIACLFICATALVGCDKGDTTTTTSTPTVTTPAYSASSNTSSTTLSAATKPDNTGVNTRDRASDAKTAGNTGQTKPDVDVTAEIRKQVMAAKLSTNAQNAKIVVQDGKVTLRGPVNSQDEKDTIGKLAAGIAGDTMVDNQLDVQSTPQ